MPELTDVEGTLRRVLVCEKCGCIPEKVIHENDPVLLRPRFVVACHGKVDIIHLKDERFVQMMAAVRSPMPAGSVVAFQDSVTGNSTSLAVAEYGGEHVAPSRYFKQDEPVTWFKTYGNGQIAITHGFFSRLSGKTQAEIYLVRGNERTYHRVPRAYVERGHRHKEGEQHAAQ